MKTSYQEVGKVGKRGVFTIPAALRKRFGFEDGSLLIAEEREDPTSAPVDITLTADQIGVEEESTLRDLWLHKPVARSVTAIQLLYRYIEQCC